MEMYGSQDLTLVLRMQHELRRDVANERLASRARKQEHRKADTRRVLGLRLSLA